MRRGVLVLGILLGLASAPAFAGDKVVYHIDDSAAQATKALRNMRNQLDADPDTEIVVVAIGQGVDFLMDGAKDTRNHVIYEPLVAALKARGVRFEVCENTMASRHLTKDRFLLEADYTPIGMLELTRLQTRQHFAYIKP